VRVFKQIEALKKSSPVFYIGVEELNGFLGFMGQCVQQLETRMKQVRHWDPLLASMRDLAPPQESNPRKRRASAHIPPRTTAAPAGGPSSVPSPDALCTAA
jgi:hypothetical protein